ncbi:MAG: hypothetical protein HY260_17505 [Chloroflexi bacterium]|nr:hypothetical protein [Chloroflexota bacterium]
MHALFVAVLLLALPVHGRTHPSGWRARIGDLAFGLALGNHVTVAFLLPPWLALRAWDVARGSVSKPGGRRARVVLECLTGILAGALIYLYLPLRAVASFLAHRMKTLVGQFAAQFGWPGLVLALSGLLAPLREGRADMVLGSRLLGGTRVAMLPHQHFGNWLAAQIVRWLYGLRLTDLGPYRAIRADLLASLDMREMTFGWPTEMIVKAARRRARIVETPVSHHPRLAGKSKISGTVRGSLLAGYFILLTTFRYALGSDLRPLRANDAR